MFTGMYFMERNKGIDYTSKAHLHSADHLQKQLSRQVQIEHRDCPNCGHELELVSIPASELETEKQMFSCFYCLEHTENLYGREDKNDDE
jgi:uncharacterized protein with PIN domain